MESLKVNTSYSPAFQRKLQLTNVADKILEKKISAMPATVDKNYRQLIRDIVNSDCDVYVSHTKDNGLHAVATKQDSDKILARTYEKEGATPISFIQEVFNMAKEIISSRA